MCNRESYPETRESLFLPVPVIDRFATYVQSLPFFGQRTGHMSIGWTYLSHLICQIRRECYAYCQFIGEFGISQHWFGKRLSLLLVS